MSWPGLYSERYKRYVTALLLVVYIFNQADRSIFGFLMEPIKRELNLSDSQLGFLAGPALAMFYVTLGVPIAQLADRSSRINIISIAVALWSGMVILSAAVGHFWQFALARVGVGIGEAGFSAIALSLIADYHSAPERTRATSIFMLAIPLGGVMSNLVGGWINQAYGWRAVFVLAGLPGLALSLLVKRTLQDPPRGLSSSAVASRSERSSLRSVCATLWRCPTLRHLAIAQGITTIVYACVVTWSPTYFIRAYGTRTGELGMWFAVIGGLGGSAGIWLGGYLTSRVGAHDERIKVRLMAVATALITPTIAAGLWCSSGRLAFSILIPGQILMLFWFGPTFALIQSLSQQNVRATMASVFILIQQVAGSLIGAQLLGVLSDALTDVAGGSASALRLSMTITLLLAWWAAVHFWLAGRTIRQDLKEAGFARVDLNGAGVCEV